MNKPVYFGLSILDISKIVIYEFWYDHMKQKCRKKNKIMLHGYRQLYSLHRSTHLGRYCF